MKKYLFFIILICACNGLLVKSTELPHQEREKNFSLKNSGPGSIYFMAVNNEELKEGLLRPEDSTGYFFEAGDLFSITQPTRLYIWEENLPNSISQVVLDALKKEVLGSQLLPIDQIDFSFKPDWFYEFSPGKVIHVKWKKGKLLPREGNKSRRKSEYRGRHTQEGYVLFNNVTKDDVNSNAWVFDAEEGRWLNRDAIFRAKLFDAGFRY